MLRRPQQSTPPLPAAARRRAADTGREKYPGKRTPQNRPAFSFAFWRRCGIIGPAKQIVGADVIVIGQLYQNINREIPKSLFIPAVYIGLDSQIFRHRLLRIIVILPQIVHPPQIQPNHLSKRLPFGCVYMQNVNRLVHFILILPESMPKTRVQRTTFSASYRFEKLQLYICIKSCLKFDKKPVKLLYLS